MADTQQENPPDDRMERRSIMLPKSMLRQIDDLRWARRHRTEAEIVRLLIQAGLEQQKATKAE